MSKPNRQKSIRELWVRYSRGDPLTDHDIARLIESGEKGAEYLQARGENLALSKTLKQLSILGEIILLESLNTID